MELTHYLKAGYPALHVVTQEPLRAISSIKAEGWKSFAWDCLRGITEPSRKSLGGRARPSERAQVA